MLGQFVCVPQEISFSQTYYPTNDNPTIKSAVPVPQLIRLLLLAC